MQTHHVRHVLLREAVLRSQFNICVFTVLDYWLVCVRLHVEVCMIEGKADLFFANHGATLIQSNSRAGEKSLIRYDYYRVDHRKTGNTMLCKHSLPRWVINRGRRPGAEDLSGPEQAFLSTWAVASSIGRLR